MRDCYCFVLGLGQAGAIIANPPRRGFCGDTCSTGAPLPLQHSNLVGSMAYMSKVKTSARFEAGHA